jgi:hypothetical protein
MADLTYPSDRPLARSNSSFSVPSILAIVAAIGSFMVGGSGFLALILAGAAVLLGVIGLVLALGPNTRGGVVSVLSVGAGVLGVVVAIVRLVMWLASA